MIKDIKVRKEILLQYFEILSMMSPVFKFHLLVPAAERRGVKPEKIGQCRVWAECGVEGSGPVGRGREREREREC